MFLAISPRKPFAKANLFARLTYLTIFVQGLLLFAFALSRGSLFGGKIGIAIAILDFIAGYLVIDNGLLFLRGKPNGRIMGFLITILNMGYYINAFDQSALNKVGAVVSVLVFLLLLLPKSNEHMVKNKKTKLSTLGKS